MVIQFESQVQMADGSTPGYFDSAGKVTKGTKHRRIEAGIGPGQGHVKVGLGADLVVSGGVNILCLQLGSDMALGFMPAKEWA